MAFNVVTLVPSSAQNASGAGAWQPVPTASMLAVQADITAGSGTVSDFDLWVEGTNDPADTTGFDVPADQVLKHANGAAANTVAVNQRDIVSNKASITAERFLGIFKHFPFKYCRARWAFTGGSSPSLTLSVTAGAK